MSDDFGTINLRRGERAREIEVLRQHYRQHREALARMVADAPTEHLASEYQRLIAEIDRALGKLDELEGRPAAAAAAAVPPPQHEPTRPHGDPLASHRPTNSAGMRPLAGHGEDTEVYEAPTLPPPNESYAYEPPRSRVALIVGAALVALALIGWLIWRASSDRDPAAGAVVEEPTATSTAPDTAAAEPAVAGGSPTTGELSVVPPSNDYGTIRRGTRAVRQFDVTNNTDEPVTIQVARSTCRCLYYDYTALVPPRAKETVTVTVDAAKAKQGALRETIRVSAKSDPAVATSFDVIATIQ